MLSKNQRYKAEIVEHPKQTYPKKYFKGSRLLNGKVYVCFWVADTPYSKYPPKPAIVFKTKNMYCRVVLDHPADFLALDTQLSDFIWQNIKGLITGYEEAKKDWEKLHNPEFKENHQKDMEKIYQDKDNGNGKHNLIPIENSL